MVLYRRNRVPGGTYFFTLTLADRSSRLLVDHIDLLRTAFAEVRRHHPFQVVAAVVLPEHLHCLWRLPDGDDRYAMRWRMIKSRFTVGLRARGVHADLRGNGERRVWQRRYWEHTIRDDEDLRRHIDYIHYNPVKHSHARSVAEWPHSSFKRHVARGWLPGDWAQAGEAAVDAGE